MTPVLGRPVIERSVVSAMTPETDAVIRRGPQILTSPSKLSAVLEAPPAPPEVIATRAIPRPRPSARAISGVNAPSIATSCGIASSSSRSSAVTGVIKTITSAGVSHCWSMCAR